MKSVVSSEIEQLKIKWRAEQETLKHSLWIPTPGEEKPLGSVRYIASVDISYGGLDHPRACAALVLFSYPDLELVYEAYDDSIVVVPYVSGFLAFRELEPLLRLVRACTGYYSPDIILVDGHGCYHPHAFGLACHLGVLLNLPTIGVAKNYLYHPHWTTKAELSQKRQEFQQQALENDDQVQVAYIQDTHDPVHPKVLGVAFWSTLALVRPIYISTGHAISLTRAIEIVSHCSDDNGKYKTRGILRQADRRSRAKLKDWMNLEQRVTPTRNN